MRTFLLASTAWIALASGSARATVTASASLFQPTSLAGAVATIVDVQDAAATSADTYAGAGYTISFADVGTDQGIVQGTLANMHATPVAGVTSSGAATYLTGDYGSAQTADIASSGKYLSAGTGTITITFAVPQTSLALLWGSIDYANQITFGNAAHDTLTGSQVQGLLTGFAGNGFQGAAGSAYVTATTSTAFTSVMLSSGTVSFEAADIVASRAAIASVLRAAIVPVPEPASLALLGTGVVSVTAGRRRRSS